MADSTSNIDLMDAAANYFDLISNAYLDAASPATLYGRRASSSSGLTWGYYGGRVMLNGVSKSISNGTLTLTASTTNYVEANPSTGAVSRNTTGFTAGRVPLYTIVTGASTVTSYTDHRLTSTAFTGRLAKAMSDANTTLTQAEASNDILEFTGTLSVQRNIVVPLLPQQWTVFNNTTGGFGLQFIGASGSGIVVAAGKRAILYADGTNVVRATADT